MHKYIWELIFINKIFNTKNDIYLEIALIINSDLYKENNIDYYIYKTAENKSLKLLNNKEEK